MDPLKRLVLYTYKVSSRDHNIIYNLIPMVSSKLVHFHFREHILLYLLLKFRPECKIYHLCFTKIHLSTQTLLLIILVL